MCKAIWIVDCGVWRVEHKFSCGITGLRKAEKMSKTMIVLISWARQQPMRKLKHWRKWFGIIVELLDREVADDVDISLDSCQVIFTDVLGMNCAAAKIVPKLINFDQKQRRIDIALVIPENPVQICLKRS